MAAHVAIWALALALAPTLIPVRQLVAEGFSTLAIVSASLNLMLSTRARSLERWLQGLDKLFVTHRTVGLTVAVLVSTHYLLVPKSIGFVASKPFGYTTIVLLLTAIFVASAPRFPWKRLVPLKYQTWKATHRFMGGVVALAVTHSLLAHTYVKTSPLLAGYVYGIAGLGLCAYLYRELAFRRFGPFHAFRIGHTRTLGGDVAEVTLASSQALTRAAGQFLIVSFEAGPSREQHPFTVSSGTAGDVRFSVKGSGDFTRDIVASVPAVGSDVTVEGPYGAFDYRRGLPRQLWLAGGIGITPFLSMAADLGEESAVTLVWSVHDMGEAIYEQDLMRLCERKPNLTFRLHPTAEMGHLDVGGIELDGGLAGRSVFICGPVPMRLALVRSLRSLGVPRDRIHFEEFRLR